MERMKEVLVTLGLVILAITIALVVTWNKNNNSYMELLQIKEASEAQAVDACKQEYLGVISDILEQEQILLTLELTKEEKELLKKSQITFEEEPNVKNARHYVGTMAYIVTQHNANP